MKKLFLSSTDLVKDKVLFFFTHLRLRRTIKQGMKRLSPWYQPVKFGFGLHAVVRDKTGHRYGPWSMDRGIRKWKAFIQPNLPFDLTDKRVLELGCNAGLFLMHCVKQGAREAVGIEKDNHYYEQARFVIQTLRRLYGGHYPIRIYQGPMEAIDYDALGRFDLALLLNVIYHIGKSTDDNQLDHRTIAQIQIEILRKVSNVAEYLLLQANPLKDEGRGKGKESLLDLVQQAGLKVVQEKIYNHPRGYILLVKSGNYQKIEKFPISRMVSKYFLPAAENAERELVELYAKHGDKGFDIAKTRYYRLRTGQLDWKDDGVAHLPGSLDRNPEYWVMPWSMKYRKANKVNTKKKISTFPWCYANFVDLMDSILKKGFDPAREGIPGYRLVHPDLGQVFIYVDGNQRMGVLSYLADQSPDEDFMVPVQVRQVVEREKLFDYPLTRQLVEEGYFTEKDVLKWFDNAFWFLKR